MDLLFPLLIVFMIGMIFFSNRQRKKQAQQQESLQNAISVGDVVVMTSGISGTVVDTDDEKTIDLEIAPDVITTWLRAAVREKLAGDPDVLVGDVEHLGEAPTVGAAEHEVITDAPVDRSALRPHHADPHHAHPHPGHGRERHGGPGGGFGRRERGAELLGPDGDAERERRVGGVQQPGGLALLVLTPRGVRRPDAAASGPSSYRTARRGPGRAGCDGPRRGGLPCSSGPRRAPPGVSRGRDRAVPASRDPVPAVRRRGVPDAARRGRVRGHRRRTTLEFAAWPHPPSGSGRAATSPCSWASSWSSTGWSSSPGTGRRPRSSGSTCRAARRSR